MYTTDVSFGLVILEASTNVVMPDPSPEHSPPSTDPTTGQNTVALNCTLSKLIRRFIKQYRRRQHLQTDVRLPTLFSTEHINELEDSFVPSAYLSWDDETTQIIDYAYAYEGVIIPGGQIMMGRWWRMHGEDG